MKKMRMRTEKRNTMASTSMIRTLVTGTLWMVMVMVKARCAIQLWKIVNTAWWNENPQGSTFPENLSPLRRVSEIFGSSEQLGAVCC